MCRWASLFHWCIVFLSVLVGLIWLLFHYTGSHAGVNPLWSRLISEMFWISLLGTTGLFTVWSNRSCSLVPAPDKIANKRVGWTFIPYSLFCPFLFSDTLFWCSTGLNELLKWHETGSKVSLTGICCLPFKIYFILLMESLIFECLCSPMPQFHSWCKYFFFCLICELPMLLASMSLFLHFKV